MPHAEYPDAGLIDFKIETYPELDRDQKNDLLKSFNNISAGIVGFFSQTGKWTLFNQQESREATEEEIANLPKLPENWETYAYFESNQQ